MNSNSIDAIEIIIQQIIDIEYMNCYSKGTYLGKFLRPVGRQSPYENNKVKLGRTFITEKLNRILEMGRFSIAVGDGK